MTLAQPAPSGLSPEMRATLFYLCLFTTAGAANAFGGIWFESRGLSAAQIGVVNALPVLVTLLLNIAIGRIADRASDWRQTIVIAAVSAAIWPLGLIWADGFLGTLTFWTLTAVSHMAITPVLDAAAMKMTARRGTDFGAMRAWGTIGYLIVIVGTGLLVGRAGNGAFLPLFIALAALRMAVAFALPRFRAPAGERAAPIGATRLVQVMKPWFVLPLFGFAILFGSHLILNAFQGLLWQRQGIALPVIGLLIALGAVSETVMFFLFRRIPARFSPRHLLTVSGIVTVLRWIAMGFAPDIWFLIPLQALHGITYGLGFMACLRFINTHTSEDIAAQTQGFFVMLQQAMSVMALLGFGALVDGHGPRAYFASAAFAAAGVLCVLASIRMRPPAAQP